MPKCVTDKSELKQLQQDAAAAGRNEKNCAFIAYRRRRAAADPEFRARMNERNRACLARKKAKQQEAEAAAANPEP